MALLLLLPSLGAEKKRTAEPSALITGSVFKEPGFALSGAEVTLTSQPESGTAPASSKKQRALTGGRGEFAFRVSVAAQRYSLHASARGFSPQDKAVSIEGEQHKEVTFLLSSESK